MNLRHLSFLVLVFLFAACEQEGDDVITLPIPDLNPDRINFLDPVVGQFNEFERFTYGCGSAEVDPHSSVKLEVTAVSETSISFLESYTTDDREAYEFTAQREPERIVLEPEVRTNSVLFFFYGSDYLEFTANPTTRVSYEDCVFFDGTRNERFTGDYVAYVPNFEMLGETYENLKVVSCVPVVLGIDGYLLFDQYTLHASMTIGETEFMGFRDTTVDYYRLKE